MIKITGLEKSYGSQVIFDNVSFVMNPGERIGNQMGTHPNNCF